MMNPGERKTVTVSIDGKDRKRTRIRCLCGYKEHTLLYDGYVCVCGQRYNLYGQRLNVAPK